MQIIVDGLGVIQTHWVLLLGILLVVVCGQWLLTWALKGIFGTQWGTAEYYAFSIGGWLLPASLISLLWYAVGTDLSPQLLIFILILPTFAAIVARSRSTKTTSSRGMLVSLILLTVLFLLLRLVFVARAILPLYFDSAQHYLWIRDLLANIAVPNAPANWPLTNYYHLGFHFLTAFISSITRAGITDVMLLLGQVILAIMPFPLFFIIRHATGSNGAATFALMLAAFGWYMPAHAVDWGKYPALAGIALIPFVLSLAYLSVQNKDLLGRGKYWGLNAILVSGVLVSIFLHSRALIVFGIAALAWTITAAWRRLPKLGRFLVLCLVLAVLTAVIVFIEGEGIVGPLFDPYGNKGLAITAVVLFLSIFAYQAYPHVVFACVVSTLFLIASLFIPFTDVLPGYVNMTLLDRPFVEVILYLPLTLLGGFGLAALEQMLQDRQLQLVKSRFSLSSIISVFVITLVLILALFQYDLHPADCCDIVSADDLQAIDWMDRNLPDDALILVSSTELKVLPTDEYQGSAGGDAGTWVNPLIRRSTSFMPFSTDFSQQQTLDTVCQLHADYVYVGGTGFFFDHAGMSVHPDRYKIVFSLPKAKVYEVTGCE